MPPLQKRMQPLRAASGLLRKPYGIQRENVCCFCALLRSTRPTVSHRPRSRAVPVFRRWDSTVASPALAAQKLDPRRDLENALLDLGKHAANYVNLSRLQLALNGLRQTSGSESIRVAVLGLTNGTDGGKTAKQVLRLLLADPLKAEDRWERDIADRDLTQSMVIRISAEQEKNSGTHMSMSKGNLLREVNVSSPTLNGHNLEILLMETNPYAAAPQDESMLEGFEDAVLVPTVDIPTSNTGRYTPITTPVHKALLVADGILGAASVTSLPLIESEDVIKATVNLPECKPADISLLPFTLIDAKSAETGLELIRNDLGNAMEYERLWFQSNVAKLVEWLKSGILTTPDGSTKPPVRRLIASLLQNASASIQREEARQLASSLSSSADRNSIRHLQTALAEWAESAHTELQQQLDIAFSSSRWRGLSWWKLFWRVDDVGMLTSDILNQRFLTKAERNIIYLAGRIEEAGVADAPVYALPAPDTEIVDEVDEANTSLSEPAIADPTSPSRWPTNISTIRTSLLSTSIPSLQALAQKLVLETLSTSTLTTSLGALVYFGTLTTSLTEASAVALLGIVWSMRRMQKRWETARQFWEGEVREEGRQAVRGVERDVGRALEGQAKQGGITEEENRETQRARECVDRAREALERLR